MQDVSQLRRLPAVGHLLQESPLAELTGLYGREALRVQATRVLDAVRAEILAGIDDDELAERIRGIPETVRAALEAEAPPIRRVLNATGIFLHTNLGRAPLHREVVADLADRLDAYCDLEMSLETGRRGDRGRRVENLVRALTGAEAALVVNNNAAALALALSSLASGREVLLSRGELVEIGGSFRIPDILEASGARLVEVGTTNRTRIADYERAVRPGVSLVLKVYPSNYRIQGFVEDVDPATLADFAHRHGLPLLVDEGSGMLRPEAAPQFRRHQSFQDLIDADCDLVCGSGDKLLGGPQAGLIAGREPVVARLRESPLYRALRPGRLVLTALDAVLRRHLAALPMPIAALWRDDEEHRRRVETLAARLGGKAVRGSAYVGGGSAPEQEIEGWVVALTVSAGVAARLRQGEPPVVGYQREGSLFLDLRTVDPEDDEALASAVERVLG
ncbi:MAG: L-seryl-tRNA(Sec) selenium transferase [Holophagales bacterium]|nr:L-seryl-tRNA(Sec) selenium transferase [Holophagales bacterium]MYG31562.1 L-seryl-tRNA(Sec) selenium transferase [Holophagales bacterium]MYI78368.1 L-seryl-tRNA(Sec) selenium transferase [Holophagales bacterium]